ncbi:uncharacterized protein SPPG_08134 [Spizellomyces punctatus DAOM BR117]|uniref:PB1 domain-containing protein n=1 Tax=Spizellomyces punctatus (strain DAOM BR117) TaxID=645134 RepID=A0A0L0H6L4_SPIPD|nr:uncharacterized protein SPPG_08134 [Spizellomyces punctatus DAOM BR117]KNC96546.1 hypothetical protein SPPG_08134 [Spizellomyces punctatus DAOM BR117]|eukprot:XP_016604586.1 hypothetical protein SPPG_08134 [Spizellomyces punctatus DAOM BR117]
MALKVELTQWVVGVEAYENGDFDGALRAFEQIADTSKIHFNIAMTFVNMGLLDEAIAALTRSVACDPFLAVAYFMRGVCLYNSNALNDSLADFNDALTYLRGNQFIDYAQLGLPYKLYSAKVSFNRGLCLAAMGQANEAYRDFDDAVRSRPSPSDSQEDLGNMDEALKMGERAPEYLGPYALPPDLIYRPPKGKVKNSDKKDYIGKAKVVASVEATDNYAGFSGRELKMKTLPRAATTGRMLEPRSNGASGGLAKSATISGATTRGLPVRSATTNSPTRAMSPFTMPRRPAPDSLGRSDTFNRSEPLSRSNTTSRVRARSSSLASNTLPRNRNENYDYSTTSRSRAPVSEFNPIDELVDELAGNDDDYERYNRPAVQRNELRRANTASTVSSAFSSTSSVADKVKVKAHYTDTRILLVPYTISHTELIERIQQKFKTGALRLKYKDEDGEMVMITDQEDLEVAFAVSGMEWGSEGGSGRMEVYCFAT